MPKKSNKKVKRAFDVTVLEQQLEDYNKDKLLHVVDRVCRMSMSDTAGLQATADTLLNKALHANLPDRKPLAVLTRRLHDRLPRFQQEGECSVPVTLATCMADLCQRSIAGVHASIQDASGICSTESSFSGGMNDENEQPQAPATPAPGAPSPAPSDQPAAAKASPLTTLQRLHGLQTFSAALYTQDVVSEVFVHSIIDHVRYGTASWPTAAKNAAVVGLCDMTKFCGKRLESLGTLKGTMQDIYSHLQLLAAGTSINDSAKEAVAEVLRLRANNWVAEQSEAANGSAVKTDAEALKAEPAAAAAPQNVISNADNGFDFAAVLGQAGIKVEGKHELPSLMSPGGGFAYLPASDEPAVKFEDMLTAVQGMDM